MHNPTRPISLGIVFSSISSVEDKWSDYLARAWILTRPTSYAPLYFITDIVRFKFHNSFALFYLYDTFWEIFVFAVD